MANQRHSPPLNRLLARTTLALAACAVALPARGSLFAGEALDTMADYVAIFVLCVVPIGVIVLFWLVHVLPEKIAEKRHHPQKDAIHTLCLLSLVFGGLLWPIAWLWAYTKPVGYKLAYGTDVHDDYYLDMGVKAESGLLSASEISVVRDELDRMDARGQLSPKLKVVRDALAVKLAALAAKRADGPPLLAEALATGKAAD